MGNRPPQMPEKGGVGAAPEGAQPAAPGEAGAADKGPEPARAGTEPGAALAATNARRPRPIFLLIGVVIAVALGIGLFSSFGSSPRSGPPRAGAAVPTFSLPALRGGGQVAVPADGGGDGRPAVLLFFASWCPPCRSEIPALASLYHHQQATHSRLAKVAVVGIDGSDPTSNALAFVRSSGVTFPVGADRTFTITQTRFEFLHLPEAVFVDGNGTIAAVHLGPVSTSQFVAWENKLLAAI